MTFEPGKSGNRKGRPPGALNKFTRTVKEAFEHTFNDLQKPGEDGTAPQSLTEWARANPGDFYKIAKILIPQKLEHAGGVTVNVASGVPEGPEDTPDVDEIA